MAADGIVVDVDFRPALSLDEEVQAIKKDAQAAEAKLAELAALARDIRRQAAREEAQRRWFERRRRDEVRRLKEDLRLGAGAMSGKDTGGKPDVWAELAASGEQLRATIERSRLAREARDGLEPPRPPLRLIQGGAREGRGRGL